MDSSLFKAKSVQDQNTQQPRFQSMTIAPSAELRSDLLAKPPTKQITEKSSDSFEEVKHDEV